MFMFIGIVETTETTKIVVFCYRNNTRVFRNDGRTDWNRASSMEVLHMKGPNPFVIWEENPMNICGRREEVRIFNAFLNATSSKQPGMFLVTGGPGLGKTTMLRHFSRLAQKEGLLAPYVNVEKGESAGAVADKLYHEAGATQGLAIGGRKAPEGFEGLITAAGSDRKHFGAIFFIDDIDKMKKANDAVASIEKLVKSSWKRRRVSFVLSSTRDFRITSPLLTRMPLRPFEEHEAREVVDKALKKGPPKMGEECFNSVMKDTQGNPLLFKTVCHHIYARLRDNEKVISKGHYLAYLPHIMSMLSREWFGRMYQETPAAEREILMVLAKNESMHVSDVAEELDKPLGPVTALVKRLLDRGQIVKLDRGRYRIFARLYGKYVLQRG